MGALFLCVLVYSFSYFCDKFDNWKLKKAKEEEKKAKEKKVSTYKPHSWTMYDKR